MSTALYVENWHYSTFYGKRGIYEHRQTTTKCKIILFKNATDDPA